MIFPDTVCKNRRLNAETVNNSRLPNEFEFIIEYSGRELKSHIKSSKT